MPQQKTFASTVKSEYPKKAWVNKELVTKIEYEKSIGKNTETVQIYSVNLAQPETLTFNATPKTGEKTAAEFLRTEFDLYI